MTLSYAPPTQEQLLDALTALEWQLLGCVRPPQASNAPAARVEEAEAAAA